MGTFHGLFGLSTGQVLVRGRRAAVLSVSLEHARLDLGDIEAEAGDEVVIIGRQGDEEITVSRRRSRTRAGDARRPSPSW